MSQTSAGRWIENDITQAGINPVLNSSFTTLESTQGSGDAGVSYCDVPENIKSKLPGQTSVNQKLLKKNPYAPVNCNQFATLEKPFVNPMTLRGKTTGLDTQYSTDDSAPCILGCGENLGPLINAVNCIDNPCKLNTQFCSLSSSNCTNRAPGGLADWMGRPLTSLGDYNNASIGEAINLQLGGGKEGSNNYKNPLNIKQPDLMKHGFITEGCECQEKTSNFIYGGTKQNDILASLGRLNDNKINTTSSEVWNGDGTCYTWNNLNIGDPNDIKGSVCNMDILKYAETCRWCRDATLSVPIPKPYQTYPPGITYTEKDIFGNITKQYAEKKPCTFRAGTDGKYNIDNGDCMGFGVNGKPRSVCSNITEESFNCAKLTSGQKIGFFCNVPAANRLVGGACAYAQAQDIVYMTRAIGDINNNYLITYSNGPVLSVQVSGDLNTQRTYAIKFPNETTTAQSLITYLRNQSVINSELEMYVTNIVPVGDPLPSGNELQSSVPPKITEVINTNVWNSGKTAYIGMITYIYRYSSDYLGYNGSYLDGDIILTYDNGAFNVTSSGNWSRDSGGTNIVNITFPNGMLAKDLVARLNSPDGFQKSGLQPKVSNLLAYTAPSTEMDPQTARELEYKYPFKLGSDKDNKPLKVPGNCNVHLDGSLFTGIWKSGTVYTDPTTGVIEPWIGKIGEECKLFPNEGKCEQHTFKPRDTGDCQICDSDFWKWIPGGVDAVLNADHDLHELALTAYVPKRQTVSNTTSCSQPFGTMWHGGVTETSVAFCGKIDKTTNNQTNPLTRENNDCQKVCSDNCSVVTWVEGPDDNLSSGAIQTKANTLVKNLSDLTGGYSANIPDSAPGESCPNMLCERHPALTLRGTSESENTKLAQDWVNGRLDLSVLHGEPTGINSTLVDPRMMGDNKKIRMTKAMRCCLGVSPGFDYKVKGSNGLYTEVKGPNPDDFGGDEMWNLSDCPPGMMCPSSDACKELFKGIMDGSNIHMQMDLDDFGKAGYADDFTLKQNGTSATGTALDLDVLTNPAYYAKAYCELMSGGGGIGDGAKINSTMGFDDEVNTLCRKTMYKYCSEPVTVDLIKDANYFGSDGFSSGVTYAKDTYQLPLKMFTKGCNMWMKNDLTHVMPSDYGTRDMLLGKSCQKLQADGWYNPVAPHMSPLLAAFVDKDGKVTDSKTGKIYDLNHSTTGGGVPQLMSDTCNCFLQGSKCQSTKSSNCSYQYCGAGTDQSVSIDYGNNTTIPKSNINSPVDLTPYSSKLDSNGKPLGDSSWSRYQSLISPAWSSGLDGNNFTCATGSISDSPGLLLGEEAGGTSNCYVGCNYVNEYDVCWNASPTNRKYSGPMLGNDIAWGCDFKKSNGGNGGVEGFENGKGFEGFENGENGDTCDPNRGGYSCFGDCEYDSVDSKGNKIPNCGTKTWFDKKIGLTPKEKLVKSTRSEGKADIMNTPYWQNFYSGASKNVASVDIRGIGLITNPQRSQLEAVSSCASSVTSIKPYNSKFDQQQTCIITQTTSFNNQGNISGSVGVNQSGFCNTSNVFEDDSAKTDFLKYMGSALCSDNNGGGNSECLKSSNFCLTDGTTGTVGDNCMFCGTPPIISISPFYSPNKPDTCCLDPDIPSNNKNENTNILNSVTLGTNKTTKVVSYICAANNSCPVGSTSINTLQDTVCGSRCDTNTDETSCKLCQYCKWGDVYDANMKKVGSKCMAACKPAPLYGWGNTKPPVEPEDPDPSDGPDGPDPTSPPVVPNYGMSSLSVIDVVFVIIGVLIGVIFLIFAVYLGVSEARRRTKAG